MLSAGIGGAVLAGQAGQQRRAGVVGGRRRAQRRAENVVEQPAAALARCGGGRCGVGGCARGFLHDHGDAGGQHPAVGHGLGGFAAHVARFLRDDGGGGFVAVEQVPLHAGEHAVLQPLVGAGGVGADPTGGEGDGGDDHGPPQVDLQDLAVSAVAHAYPGLGGVGAGHCLGGTGSGRAAWG